MRGLVWLREDLRCKDNSALYHAAQECNDGVIAIFLIDATLWQKHHMAACRVDLLLRGLHTLRDDLAQCHIPLQVIQISSNKDTVSTLLHFAQQQHIAKLFFNNQYEFDELQRDQRVITALNKVGIEHESFDDAVILPPGRVLNQQGEMYKVFTPFKRAWQTTFLNSAIAVYPKPKSQKQITLKLNPIPNQLIEFPHSINSQRWPAGEKIAAKRLKHFITEDIADYERFRDYPALSATSQLSPYLSTGMISPRTCFLAAADANSQHINHGKKGVVTWLSELIWREFYKHLLVAVPRLSKNKAYKIETEKLAWSYNKKDFNAWKNGQTGFPIIDAAMRQLNQTGWMHNRLRMITAMFLTKNCFIDWRWGEKYFIQNLIDGDLAANNGGWQWCASTGTDAAPYFRIFNPTTQSKRFDPDGEFIKTYCPELKDFNKKEIHEPYKFNAELARKNHYPEPMLDLKITAQEAIKAFRGL